MAFIWMMLPKIGLQLASSSFELETGLAIWRAG